MTKAPHRCISVCEAPSFHLYSGTPSGRSQIDTPAPADGPAAGTI